MFPIFAKNNLSSPGFFQTNHKIFKTPISRSVKLSEAPSFGEPICYIEPYSKGALEYQDAAKELMMRI